MLALTRFLFISCSILRVPLSLSLLRYLLSFVVAIVLSFFPVLGLPSALVCGGCHRVALELVAYSYEPSQIKELELRFREVSSE